MFDQIFKGMNVLEQLHFGRQDVGVFEHVVADAELFGYPAQIFQLQWFAFARQVIKGAFALGFENALLGDPMEKRDSAGWCWRSFHPLTSSTVRGPAVLASISSGGRT